MSSRPGTTAIALAFAGIYIIWGTTFLGIALAIRTIPPFVSGAVRFIIASALIYLWLRRRERQPFAGLNIGGTLLCGVLLSGVGNGFVIWAQLGLPSGITALFICSLPVMVLLLDWAFFSRRAPTARGVLGVVIGFSGIIVLTLHSHALSGQVRPAHVIAVMLSQLGWATGSLLQRRYVPPESIAGYTCLQMFSGGIFQLLLSGLDHEWGAFSLAQVSLQSLLAVAYLIVFGSIIAVNCYSFLLAHVPAQKVSTYALVNPVIALALGALVLHERITPMALLCAVLVMLGVTLVLWRGAERTPPVPAESSRLGGQGT
ncbi:MAG TPA: EamA family transporter [Steroidobacteraceae bacterium]